MSVAEISKGKPTEVAGRARPSLAPLRNFAAAPGRGFLLTAGSIAIAFLSWQVLSTFIFNPFLIPPPLEVIRTAIPMILSGEILADVSISMSRVLVGFAVGSLAAIVFGVLLGRLQLLHDLLDPIIELMRYLSPTAMIPIAVIWFGIGELPNTSSSSGARSSSSSSIPSPGSGARRSRASARPNASAQTSCRSSSWSSYRPRRRTS